MNRWILASAVLLLIPFLANTYGQSESAPISLLLQLEIRDESGQLVGYIESADATIFDYQALSDFLDANTESLKKQNITVGDNEFEVFTAVGYATHASSTVYSHSIISGKQGIVAFANHDGFLINPGDRTVSTWTIIRSVP